MIEKVLVTGGCGRLGRYVVDELTRRFHVTTLDVADSPWTLPHLRVDILDLPGLHRACARQDAVVHLAALEIDMTHELRAEISSLSPEPPPATDRNDERSESGWLAR